MPLDRDLFAVLAAAGIACATPAAAVTTAEGDGEITVSHGISTFGELKYPADLAHLDYVNPEAPKGGTLTLGAPGSFDTLNIVPLGGETPRSIPLIYDSLMVGAADEAVATSTRPRCPVRPEFVGLFGTKYQGIP